MTKRTITVFLQITQKNVIILSIFLIATFGKVQFCYALNVDSLESVINQQITSNQISKALASSKILNEYFYQKDMYDLVLKFADQNLKLAEATGDKSALIFFLRIVGDANKNLNQYDKALEYLFRIIEIEKENLSIKKDADIPSMIAAIYQALGDYQKAYDFQIQALEIGEENKDSIIIAKSLYRMGSIFFYQRNHELALEHYQKTLVLSESIQNSKMIYNANCAIGSTYEGLGEYEKALAFDLKALNLAKQIGYENGVAYALLNAGGVYMSMGNYAHSEEYLLEALSINKKLKDKWGQIGSLRSLGELKTSLRAYDDAVKYYSDALILSREIGSKSRVLELYTLLAHLYEKMGNYAEAYSFLRKEVVLKDTILNETTMKEMGKRKTRYEVQKKESEIALLKKESEIATLNAYILIGTALFLLIFIGVLFKNNRVQKNSNKLLGEKNKEIFLQNEKLEEANRLQQESHKLLEEKNAQIEIQNDRLEESNNELAQFAYVASHDLKEPLRMINSYTQLLGRRYNHLFDDTAKEFFFYVTDGVKRMEEMLTDLLKYSRVNSQQDEPEVLNTGTIMEIVGATLQRKLAEEGGTIIFEPKELPDVKSNKTHMTQLFQNLVSNGLKFRGEKDPVVTVKCVREGDKNIFSVQDNGIGISDENKPKIFEMFRRLHTRDEYEGTGIGLATVKKIVERYGGTIWVESTVGEGSTFFFSFPVVQPEIKTLSDIPKDKGTIMNMN